MISLLWSSKRALNIRTILHASDNKCRTCDDVEYNKVV